VSVVAVVLGVVDCRLRWGDRRAGRCRSNRGTRRGRSRYGKSHWDDRRAGRRRSDKSTGRCRSSRDSGFRGG
jgi:hypothetical protein